MSLRLNGSTSGYVEIDAPAVAGTTNVTIPATSGEVAIQATDGSVDLGNVNIDSSGRLLVGTSTASNQNNAGGASARESKVYIFNANSTSTTERFSLAINSGSANANGPSINLNKTRAATDTHTVVQSGDTLGEIRFQGSDGTFYVLGARIEAAVDGTPGSQDMPGRLTFSTTADGASSPTERMRIGSPGSLTSFSAGAALSVFSAAASGSSNHLIRGFHSCTDIGGTGGTQCFRVSMNGNVQNTNNSYTALSDIKLKENVVDANSQWADIKALQVRNYNLKEGQTHKQIGLVAQEVEPICPGLIYETPDQDAEGNNLGTTTKAVQYSVLYMKAVKALQEAMERIETQAAAIAALETRLTALEGGTAQ